MKKKKKLKVWFCDCGVELSLEAKYLSGVQFEFHILKEWTDDWAG